MLETRNVWVSVAWEKRRRRGLRWYSTGDVLGRGVRTSVRQNPVDNDKPRLRRGCTAYLLQHRGERAVCPVVSDRPEEEDVRVFNWLWLEEVVY